MSKKDPFPPGRREEVFARDGYRCQFTARAIPARDDLTAGPCCEDLIVAHLDKTVGGIAAEIERLDMAIAAPCAGEPAAHHMVIRSRGGGHELENLVVLCRHHHEWIHSHPALASAIGLIRRIPIDLDMAMGGE